MAARRKGRGPVVVLGQVDAVEQPGHEQHDGHEDEQGSGELHQRTLGWSRTAQSAMAEIEQVSRWGVMSMGGSMLLGCDTKGPAARGVPRLSARSLLRQRASTPAPRSLLSAQ